MRKHLNLRANIALGLIFAFLVNILGPMPIAQAGEFRLPAPGQMVALSPAFDPAVLKGIKLDPQDPFRFHFFVDRGDSRLNQKELKNESAKLIKYFLASLTIPEKDLWVNLSPYEKNRIVPPNFGQTEMGRDLLAEDYLLKQITASLIYPESRLGKEFWQKVYAQAQAKYGTTSIPINTFNKVWIVPDKAVVYENGGTAFVLENHLKVMLEQDYLSLAKHSSTDLHLADQGAGASALGSQIVREIVIPALTKEVNEGKNFAQLRQVFYSLILATWYKKKIKDSILNKIYANKNKIAGVGYGGNNDTELIYQRYLQAFKKGVYNYIKEDPDQITNQSIPRKYFSGGVDAKRLIVNMAMIGPEQVTPAQRYDLAQKSFVEVTADAELISPHTRPVVNAAMADAYRSQLIKFFPGDDYVAHLIMGTLSRHSNHLIIKLGERRKDLSKQIDFWFREQANLYSRFQALSEPFDDKGIEYPSADVVAYYKNVRVLIDQYIILATGTLIPLLEQYPVEWDAHQSDMYKKSSVLMEVGRGVKDAQNFLSGIDLLLEQKPVPMNFEQFLSIVKDMIFSNYQKERKGNSEVQIDLSEDLKDLNFQPSEDFIFALLTMLLPFRNIRDLNLHITAQLEQTQGRDFIGIKAVSPNDLKRMNGWAYVWGQSERLTQGMGGEYNRIKDENGEQGLSLRLPVDGVMNVEEQKERLAVAVRSLSHGELFFREITEILNNRWGDMVGAMPVFSEEKGGIIFKKMKEEYLNIEELWTSLRVWGHDNSEMPESDYPAILRRIREILLKVDKEKEVQYRHIDELKELMGNDFNNAKFQEALALYLEGFDLVKLKLESRLNIAGGKLSRDRITIKDLIGLLLSSIPALSIDKRLSFDSKDTENIVLGYNRFQLASALFNLINNAISKINELPDGTKGRILVKFEQKDQKLLITVTDNGPGIPADFRKYKMEDVRKHNDITGRQHIFDLKATIGGTGVGTTEAWYVIKDMGGTIRASNLPEGGAEFTIELPINQAQLASEMSPVQFDAEWEKYVQGNGLSQYPKVLALFPPLIKQALLDDRSLRPVFLQELPKDALDKIVVPPQSRDLVNLKVNDGTLLDLMEKCSSFFIGDAKSANDLLEKPSMKIIVGATDIYSEDTLHNTFQVANGRQAYFPLPDGTWLGVKGSGQYRLKDKPVFYKADDREGYYGLANENEAKLAIKGTSVFKQGEGSFVPILGYRRILKAPDGHGGLVSVQGLKRGDGSFFDPVLIFNRMLYPQRLVKLPQLIKADPGLEHVRRIISNTMSKLGRLPDGTVLSASELILKNMESIGHNEALKQNNGMYKYTMNNQDLGIAPEETDNEEFRNYEVYRRSMRSRAPMFAIDSNSLLMNEGLSMAGMYNAVSFLTKIMTRYYVPEDQQRILLPSAFDALRVLFHTYFSSLDDRYLKIWATGKAVNGAVQPLPTVYWITDLSRLHHNFGQGMNEAELDREVRHSILLWAKQEIIRRRQGQTSASVIRPPDEGEFKKPLDIKAYEEFKNDRTRQTRIINHFVSLLWINGISSQVFEKFVEEYKTGGFSETSMGILGNINSYLDQSYFDSDDRRNLGGEMTVRILNLSLTTLGFAEKEGLYNPARLPDAISRAFAANEAMQAVVSKQAPGGIDLNPAQMSLQVKKQGEDFKFNFNGMEIDAAQVTGATFTIRKMAPVTNLPQILGLNLRTAT